MCFYRCEIALAFCSVGARVIMVNRKEEHRDQAMKKIKDAVPDAKIEWEGCDMGNLKQVKEVFTKIADREDRLDLVFTALLY